MPFKGVILDVAVDWMGGKLDFEWFILSEDINFWILIAYLYLQQNFTEHLLL